MFFRQKQPLSLLCSLQKVKMKVFLAFIAGLVLAAATKSDGSLSVPVEVEEDSGRYYKNCPDCPNISRPTCGFNGQCVRWFSTPCTLQQFNCHYADFYGTSFTQCDASACQQCCPESTLDRFRYLLKNLF